MDKKRLIGTLSMLSQACLFVDGFIAQKSSLSQYRTEEQITKDKKAGFWRSIGAVGMGLGFFLMSRYGNYPVERQSEKLQQRMYAFLEKEGATLEQPEWQQKITDHNNRSLFRKMEDMLFKRPIEFVLTYIAIAHTAMIVSGKIRRASDNKHEKSAGIGNFLQGWLVNTLPSPSLSPCLLPQSV